MLQSYLTRIGYRGSLTPTEQTLAAIHRAQAQTIPYEGLDIQLGTPLDLDLHRIRQKLIAERRGGWCYETNGLLAWALKEIGFKVQRTVAGVHRRERGDAALGNHLTLLVDLGQLWLADLGLGDALRAPVPLRAGTHVDGPFTFRLERLPDGFWRFHNHSYGTPASFDFTETPADEALLAAQNTRLQSDPASHFVLNAEVVLMQPSSSVTLLGRTLRHASADGVEKQLILSPTALQQALTRHFGLPDLPVARIWPQILARHRELFGT